MANRHRGAEAVAVFATVLALAACGTEVDNPPTGTIPPVSPTTDPAEGTGDGETTSEEPVTSTVTATGATTGETATGEATTDGTGTEGTDGPSPTTATATAGEAATTDAPDSLPGFATADDVLRQDPTGATQLFIDDVRLGVQDGFDRVVIDLSGAGEVGWWVQYADAPALDGSGIPVDLAGGFVLQVNTIGMAYPEPGDTAYDPGLLLLDGGDLTTVTEVLRSAPFEGQVPVYVGTSREAPFRVFRLSGPERLVIDIQH